MIVKILRELFRRVKKFEFSILYSLNGGWGGGDGSWMFFMRENIEIKLDRVLDVILKIFGFCFVVIGELGF